MGVAKRGVSDLSEMPQAEWRGVITTPPFPLLVNPKLVLSGNRHAVVHKQTSLDLTLTAITSPSPHYGELLIIVATVNRAPPQNA
jgi:hypothetical protein